MSTTVSQMDGCRADKPTRLDSRTRRTSSSRTRFRSSGCILSGREVFLAALSVRAELTGANRLALADRTPLMERGAPRGHRVAKWRRVECERSAGATGTRRDTRESGSPRGAGGGAPGHRGPCRSLCSGSVPQLFYKKREGKKKQERKKEILALNELLCVWVNTFFSKSTGVSWIPSFPTLTPGEVADSAVHMV